MGCGASTTVKVAANTGLLLERMVEPPWLNPRTPLMWAAGEGEIKLVRKLLSKGAKIEAKDQDGKTALIRAAEEGQSKAMGELIANCADIEAKDKNGITPLILAARDGRLEVMGELIANCADIEAKDKNGITPLLSAARYGHSSAIRELIANCADIEAKTNDVKTALIRAADFGRLEAMGELIANCADIEAKDKNGWTPLIWTVSAQYVVQLEAMGELIANCADIEAKDKNGWTPLIWAALRGRLEAMGELIAKGADIEAKDNAGNTALQYARQKQNTDIVRLLEAELKKKAMWSCENCEIEGDPSSKEPSKCSAQSGRCPGDTSRCCNCAVLHEGLQVDKYQAEACSMCKARVSLLLLKAAKSGDGPSVALLLQAGGNASADAKDEGGMTALMHGALGGHLDVTTALTGAGADVEAEDSNGDTALLLAEANDHIEVIKELERAEGELHAKRDAEREAEMELRARREAKREALQADKLEKERLEREAQMEKERQEQARLQQKEDLVQSLMSEYDQSSAVLPLAEFEAMVRVIVESAGMGKDADAGASSGGREGRFSIEPTDIITGEFEDAARGLPYRLRVDEDDVNPKLHKDVAIDAMREEVAKLGDPVVSEHLAYVLDEEASEKVYPNGIRDRGNVGKTLKDFAAHPNAVTANLTTAEAAALRFYTTMAFKVIDDPLRDTSSGKPHPLPVTVMLIARGIKKLRTVGAKDRSAVKAQVLLRGMKNVKTSDAFVELGGTELAPMSTTTDIKTATEYSISDNSLVFYIYTKNSMQRGADIQFLSAFPAEAEVLYPPLTYLQPTGKMQEVAVQGRRFTVVEVEPTVA